MRAYFVISGGSLSIVETSKHIICPPPVPVAQMRRQAGLLSDREFYPETNKIVISAVPMDRPVTSKISVLYKKNEPIIQNSEIKSVKIDNILELRGGDGLKDLAAVIGFIIFVNWYDAILEANGFQPLRGPLSGPYNWITGRQNNLPPLQSPSSRTGQLEMYKPSSFPQEQYSALSKSQKRQLADAKGRDRIMSYQGKPKLDVKFNQISFKSPKHADIHGAPLNKNGRVEKTEKNALIMRDSIVDMPNRKNIIWYEEGQYQGGTPRGAAAINLFDPDTKVISVFTEQDDGSYSFLTTAELTAMEEQHLIATNGNFVTERVLKEQQSVSTKVITSSSSTIDRNVENPSSSNQGFSPSNSFESDVLGFTPIDIDASQLDKS